MPCSRDRRTGREISVRTTPRATRPNCQPNTQTNTQPNTQTNTRNRARPTEPSERLNRHHGRDDRDTDDEGRQTTADDRRTTNDERRTTNDERRTTNDEQRTTNDARRTTRDERRATNDARLNRERPIPGRDHHRMEQIDIGASISFDSPRDAAEHGGANAREFCSRSVPHAHCATTSAAPREVALHSSIVAQSARHRAEKQRGRCGSC
jgi:hypothetical protein